MVLSVARFRATLASGRVDWSTIWEGTPLTVRNPWLVSDFCRYSRSNWTTKEFLRLAASGYSITSCQERPSSYSSLNLKKGRPTLVGSPHGQKPFSSSFAPMQRRISRGRRRENRPSYAKRYRGSNRLLTKADEKFSGSRRIIHSKRVNDSLPTWFPCRYPAALTSCP